MTVTVRALADMMEQWAPLALAEPWDSVGLQVGRRESTVDTVLIALDVDEVVLAHARQIGAGMVISHHPVVFRPLPAVTNRTVTGRLVLQAIESNVALYAAHTNLDRADGGVNDALCAALGLIGVPVTERIGRTATLSLPLPLGEWAAQVRQQLGAETVRVTGTPERQIRSVYVLSGAGKSEIDDALSSGADVMLTGEVGYHDAQQALYNGLAVVEVGHYHTEAPVLQQIEKHLQSECNRLQYKIRTVVWEQSTCPFWYVGG